MNSSRTASAPSKKLLKRTDAEARKLGFLRRRTQASVMMPKMPSEPMNMRSGLGPAPEPGRRRVSSVPAGVTTRVKMGQTSNVTALVKADGKFYYTTKEVKVTLGGCGG